ncbi:MAG: DegT/DnrJ/EryC1/StrS family aminotransferase [Deltaproteobacteria bacterium]|nr:DegT/DnrJ/EryC1/StrS family aminotransferase [Deltaproteobacteria bacterium]
MPGFEVFGEEERKEVQDVLETGVLHRYGFDAARKGHWKAKSFEQQFAERTGVKYCLLVSSGTAALSTALAATGIGAGDEVIIPPFTFVATFEAVIAAGAAPVFADIDHTLCLDPKAIAKALTARTKAVMPVHMCGAMAHIDEIKSFCDQKGLVLIEDVAQSVGGSFNGKALGTFGQMGCFSFDPVKTITCGEGGAVITDDEELFRQADYHADHGHDHLCSDRGLEDHPIMGTNFRISELSAAVGLAQLRKLDQIIEKQRFHKQTLKEALSRFARITFRQIPDENGDSATFLTFFLPEAEAAKKFCQKLAEAGVGGCFYWYENKWHYLRQWDHLKALKSAAKLPVTLLADLPDYQNLKLPVSDHIMSKAVSMLIMVSWTPQELQKRVETVTRIAGEMLGQ